jgi:hypothetical protein
MLLFFYLILFVFPIGVGASETSETSEANQEGNKENRFTGNYLILLPGLYYSDYHGNSLTPRKKGAFGGAIEHASRINLSHEFVIGIMNQWNQPAADGGKSSLNGYYFIWRYHIPRFMIIPHYSLFFDFSAGMYEFYGDDILGRFRTGGFGIGLGNRFSFGGNLILQFGFRLRNLQFFLPGIPVRGGSMPATDPRETQIVDTISINLGIGYRYAKW